MWATLDSEAHQIIPILHVIASKIEKSTSVVTSKARVPFQKFCEGFMPNLDHANIDFRQTTESLTNSKKSPVLLLWSFHTDKKMNFLYVKEIINPLHEKINFSCTARSQWPVMKREV